MVGTTRFELVTSAMSRQRSNQLSYAPVFVGRVSLLRSRVKATHMMRMASLNAPPSKTRAVPRRRVDKLNLTLTRPFHV